MLLDMTENLLFVDDDVDFLQSWNLRLKAEFRISVACTLEQALAKITERNPDVVFLDLHLGGECGLKALKAIKADYPQISVVMVSGDRKTQSIVDAMQNGAEDYLTKPFSKDELLATIHKVSQLKSIRCKNEALLARLSVSAACSQDLISTSKAMCDVLKNIEKVKGFDAPVLIEGESGVGKELLARRIHAQENNPKRPFIAVNCAAIPENLVESEFFGHVKGSFSGAVTDKMGLFELANKGDLFLDEINSLKPDVQAKLLRVIQDKEFRRVGGTQCVRSDFRIIAASNKSLETLVQKNEFRFDLYHRLKVLVFKVPSLKERKEDIEVLIKEFLQKFSKSKTAPQLSAEALQIFKDYAWPGNVRELQNVIQSLVILVGKTVIDVNDLPAWLKKQNASPSQLSGFMLDENASALQLRDYLKMAEREYIKRALRQNDEHRERTAEALGISRAAFYNKIKDMDLH